MCTICDSTNINTIIVTDRHSWNVTTQNAFSLPFAAILVNCAPSGEIHKYCTPHTIKENFENFLIHWCNYILLSQVYCVWQVVKTPTIIFNNPVYVIVVLWLIYLLCWSVCIYIYIYIYIYTYIHTHIHRTVMTDRKTKVIRQFLHRYLFC